MRPVLVLSSLSLICGCYGDGVSSGGDCSAEGDFVCDPSDRFWAFECNDGKWRDVHCASGGDSYADHGCVVGQFDTECRYNMVRPGDPCWTRYEGVEFCSERYDQRDIKLVCRHGTWEGDPCVNCQRPSGYPVECDE